MDKTSYIELDRKISKDRTNWYIKQTANILMEEGIISDPRQLMINMGTEIEFNKVFVCSLDKDLENSAYKKRNLQLATDHGTNFGARDEPYITKSARSYVLDDLFIKNRSIKEPKTQLDKSNRAKLTTEPAYGNNTATLFVCEWNEELKCHTLAKPIYAAYSQAEVISPIMTPQGVSGWMDKMPNTIVKESGEHGIDRVDFTSKTDDQNLFPNSVHLSISMSRLNPEFLNKSYNEKLFNPLSSCNLFSELGLGESNNEKSYQKPSQFALALASERNKIVSETFLMYAPTEKAYRRFDDGDVGAPKHMGFFPQRKMLGFGGAAFRGADIRFSRPEDTFKGTDKGPLRIEERLICPEAIGHPNRDAYPDQALMAHELIEMQAFIIWKGAQQFQKNKKEGIKLSYDDLLLQKPAIPRSKGIAENLFNNSHHTKEMFSDVLEGQYDDIPHNRGRLERITERHIKLEKILTIDNHTATLNRGPKHPRSI